MQPLPAPAPSARAAMGICGSRLQKQQRELTATTIKAGRRGSTTRGHRGLHKKQQSSPSGGTSTRTSTSTTNPPASRRANADAVSTTATTSTSTSPKPFQAPQASAPEAAAPASSGNGLDFLVPVALLRADIFPFLGASCLARAGCACRSWEEASMDENLWKALCLKRWVGKHVGKRGFGLNLPPPL